MACDSTDFLEPFACASYGFKTGMILGAWHSWVSSGFRSDPIIWSIHPESFLFNYWICSFWKVYHNYHRGWDSSSVLDLLTMPCRHHPRLQPWNLLGRKQHEWTASLCTFLQCRERWRGRWTSIRTALEVKRLKREQKAARFWGLPRGVESLWQLCLSDRVPHSIHWFIIIVLVS